MTQTPGFNAYAGMPTGDDCVSESQVACLFEAAVWTAARYHRAFGRLLYAVDLSPAEVVAEVEMADA